MKPIALDVKRLKLPFDVVANCPHCGVENRWSLKMYALYYPTANQEMQLGQCCKECSEEFFVTAYLTLELEVFGEAKLIEEVRP